MGRVEKVWNSLGVELQFPQNSSGVHPYSSEVNPYFVEVFRGKNNFFAL